MDCRPVCLSAVLLVLESGRQVGALRRRGCAMPGPNTLAGDCGYCERTDGHLDDNNWLARSELMPGRLSILFPPARARSLSLSLILNDIAVVQAISRV